MRTKEITLSELNCLIEEERAKMYKLCLMFGYNDERTLRQSEKLDCLVIKAMKAGYQTTHPQVQPYS